MSQLWEVLVPTTMNCGKRYKKRYHREWDRKVRAISGGLTVFKPGKGQWIGPSGTLFSERMIPVRIICQYAQLKEIVQLTLAHYEQEAVLAYRLGDEVLFTARGDAT